MVDIDLVEKKDGYVEKLFSPTTEHGERIYIAVGLLYSTQRESC